MQMELIVETYSDKYSLLKAYKIATGDDPDKDASPEKGYSISEKEQKDRLSLLVEFNDLINKTGTDKDLIYKTYKVKDNTEMSIAQLEQAVRQMKKKVEA